MPTIRRVGPRVEAPIEALKDHQPLRLVSVMAQNMKGSEMARQGEIDYKSFALWCLEEGPFNGCDLDGGSVQEAALKFGVIKEVKYDPKIHGENMISSRAWLGMCQRSSPARTENEGRQDADAGVDSGGQAF